MIQSFKLLLIVFASCIMTDSYAQKVVVDGAGRVIVDASAIRIQLFPKRDVQMLQRRVQERIRLVTLVLR